jgi:hypothetical protein
MDRYFRLSLRRGELDYDVSIYSFELPALGIGRLSLTTPNRNADEP